MATLELTEIRETGLPRGVYNHTLTPASGKHILMAGGRTDSGVSNKVMLFNPVKLEWRKEEPLSKEIGDGLFDHRAVRIERENGASIVCPGGFTRGLSLTHPNHMVVFDIMY